MSKILENTTAIDVVLLDVGITIPASGSYTIPPTEYLFFAASSNVVTKIGNGTLIVNDGTSDLSISDGVDLIKGLFTRIAIEEMTGGAITVSHFESYIHQGFGFSHAHTHTVNNGNTYYHLLQTPNTSKRVHFRHYLGMTGAGRVEYYENSVVSSIGGNANIYNRDRNAVNAASLIVKHAPTVTTDGSQLEAVEYTTGGNKPTNALHSDTISIVLKQNTNYLVKYSSTSSGNVFSEMYLWIEV